MGEVVMTGKYVTTQFSTSEPFFKPGDEFFQVDLSGLITESVFKQLTDPAERNHEVFSINEACEEHIREQQRDGVPLVVDSEPILIPHNRWFNNEYYIRVHLKNEPRLHFYILNSTPVMNTVWEWNLEKGIKQAHEERFPPLAFKGHGDYLEYIWDAESCAEYGY